MDDEAKCFFSELSALIKRYDTVLSFKAELECVDVDRVKVTEFNAEFRSAGENDYLSVTYTPDPKQEVF